MTYNEWRDELKSNLLSVPEAERKRVLDYYAEAYADRRDAGFSEREIIEEFGAPYDAAQRILSENKGDYYPNENSSYEQKNERESRSEERSRRREEKKRDRQQKADSDYEYFQNSTPTPNQPKRSKSGDYAIAAILICIVCCIPLTGILIGVICACAGLLAAPIALLIAGVATIGAGIGTIVGGSILDGICTMGVGIILFGVSLLIIPLFAALIKLAWKFIKWLWNSIKSLFNGKENA